MWAVAVVSSRAFSKTASSIGGNNTGNSSNCNYGNSSEDNSSDSNSNNSDDSGSSSSSAKSCSSGGDSRSSGSSEPQYVTALFPLAELFDHQATNTMGWQVGRLLSPMQSFFCYFPFFCFSFSVSIALLTINTPFALPLHTLSARSHSQTDEQTNTIVVRSYAALPAGSQLYNSYGTKSTDMFLQAYGFVPSDNPHDSFPLTSSEADLAEIYYKHYANVTVKEGRKGMFDLWAEYLLRRTSEDVRAAKEKVEEEVGVIGGPKADVFEEGSAHAVWAGGQVDPRMLLFLASLWHVFGYGEDHELTSLLAGADLVRDEVRQALARWSTPIDEDRRRLKQLEKCWWVDGKIEKEDGVKGEEGEEVGEGEEGEEEVCTKEVVQTLMERELVLQYRIAKKKLLQNVYDRLEEGCSSLLQSQSPESNSVEAPSEKSNGMLPELTVPAPPLPAEQHDEL
ncbi:unnamed protein product [Closterium sp. NIES-53]